MQSDPDQKNQMRQKLATDVLPWWLNKLEAVILENDGASATSGSENPGFCVLPQLTIADISLDCFFGWFDEGCFVGIHDELLEDFPRLCQVREAVGAVPEIQAWRA